MRTVREIYDQIIAEKESLASLNDLLPTGTRYTNLLDELSSSSKVAVWRLWAYVTAVVIFSHEALFFAFKREVEETATEAIWGTLQWYQLNTKKFQLGYTLFWDGAKFTYSVDDPSARIVAYCAVEERADGLLVIKTAKEVSGSPAPLNLVEIAALRSYALQTKFAGTRLSLVSFEADSLKLFYTVYYNPILPLSMVSQRVEDAVNNYLKSLPFNGRFRINLMTDILQKIDGIIDPVFTGAEARYGSLPYIAFTSEYASNAGYLGIDPNFPLNSTINYIPYE